MKKTNLIENQISSRSRHACCGKRGLIGWIILGIIGFVILIVLAAGFYFYNFHVFKTLRVCIGEAHNTTYSCETANDCFNATGNLETIEELNGAPKFVRNTFEEMLTETIYCDKVCFIREVRGINTETQELEMLESCYDGETEITVDIRGKEALEVYQWFKNRNK